MFPPFLAIWRNPTNPTNPRWHDLLRAGPTGTSPLPQGWICSDFSYLYAFVSIRDLPRLSRRRPLRARPQSHLREPCPPLRAVPHRRLRLRPPQTPRHPTPPPLFRPRIPPPPRLGGSPQG